MTRTGRTHRAQLLIGNKMELDLVTYKLSNNLKSLRIPPEALLAAAIRVAKKSDRDRLIDAFPEVQAQIIERKSNPHGFSCAELLELQDRDMRLKTLSKAEQIVDILIAGATH